MSITLEGEQLFGQLANQPKFLIFPESTAQVFFKIVDAQVSFEKGSDGTASIATLHQNVHLDKHDIPAGLATIDAAWARLAPGTPLRREFMDDLFRSSYSIFTGIDPVIFALAAFAFAIAAAGLIGMATFAVTRLRREIGIRKTLGSAVRQALGLIL
jgi:putative ABC transport system permease protein